MDAGWPPLLVTMWVIPEDLGHFSPKKEKNLGEQKFARLSVSNFCGRVPGLPVLFCARYLRLLIQVDFIITNLP